MDTRDLHEMLRAGLVALSGRLGSTHRIGGIVKCFIEETPMLLQKIEEYVRDGKIEQALSISHRLKPRYEYVGLTCVAMEIDRMEKMLSSGDDSYFRLFRALIVLNEEVIEALVALNIEAEDVEGAEVKLKLPVILVADDDEINALVFDLVLSELGTQVLNATDGLAAVEIAIQSSPSLIFVDMHMPGQNGLQAIQSMRRKNVTCPIIAISGGSLSQNISQLFNAGATDFLIKPIPPELIKQKFQEHCRR